VQFAQKHIVPLLPKSVPEPDPQNHGLHIVHEVSDQCCRPGSERLRAGFRTAGALAAIDDAGRRCKLRTFIAYERSVASEVPVAGCKC
jgi:hypothetical protein